MAVSSLSLNANTTLGYSGAYTGLTSNGLALSNSCLLCSKGNNVSGFGIFNLIFDQKNASTAATMVSVSLSGGGWTSAQQVLAFNSKGDSAASHVSVNGCTFYAGDGATTSPANCGSTSVPEPSVLLATARFRAGGPPIHTAEVSVVARAIYGYHGPAK